MLTYPKTRMDKRWDMMPESLREVLYSPAYGETVLQIAENHHLDEIKKEAVARLTGFVIYGFIHPEELDEKIIEELDVDRTTAKEVADEINKKIFEEFRKEISEMYSPISKTATQVESIRGPAEKGKEFGRIKITEGKPEEKEEKKIRRHGVLTPEEPGKVGEEKGEPFVIHREGEGVRGAETKDKERKSFQLGDFFGKEKKEEGPAAKVNVPKDRDVKKTVHYSEYRSTMQPGGDKRGFINIPEFQKKSPVSSGAEIGGVPSFKEQIKKEAPKKEEKKKKKGSGPSIEGNTIDLRDL